jgi:thioredoxin reductase (NADPH)
LTTNHDLIVVGEGFAGLTCANEAAKLGLKVATFEAEFQGGLVVNVNELEHFEEAGGLSGMDHAMMLARANARAGVKSTTTAVTAVRPVAGGYFEVETEAGQHTARAVVLASGARRKKLGVPGETEFEGRGVSHCADCDAPMFTAAEVVVAGGGDWALQDALVLARECSVVHLVHEGSRPTACGEYLERVQAEPKIRAWPDTTVEAVEGGAQGMTGVRLRHADGSTRELPCAGLFALVGLEPNSALAPADVRRDPAGFLQVNDKLETGVPGLWAIGQVRSGFGGWLADAAAEARRVAQAVKAHLG